jgi:hypothetical protein
MSLNPGKFQRWLAYIWGALHRRPDSNFIWRKAAGAGQLRQISRITQDGARQMRTDLSSKSI